MKLLGKSFAIIAAAMLTLFGFGIANAKFLTLKHTSTAMSKAAGPKLERVGIASNIHHLDIHKGNIFNNIFN